MKNLLSDLLRRLVSFVEYSKACFIRTAEKIPVRIEVSTKSGFTLFQTSKALDVVPSKTDSPFMSS